MGALRKISTLTLIVAIVPASLIRCAVWNLGMLTLVSARLHADQISTGGPRFPLIDGDYVGGRNVDLALRWLGRAIEARPICERYNTLAWGLLVGGAGACALKVLNSAPGSCSRSQGWRRAWLLGNALWQAGDYSRSRRTWRDSGISDEVLRHSLPAAAAMLEKGEISAAGAALRRCLRIAPQNAGVLFYSAVFFQELKDYRSAAATYARAGDLAVGDEWFKGTAYARAASIWGQRLAVPEQARYYFEQAVRVDRTDQWSWVALGHVLIANGELSNAAAAFSHVTVPGQRQYGIGMIALHRGSLKEAENAFREAVAEDSKSVEFWLGLADTLRRAGRTQEATEACAAANRLRPESARAGNCSPPGD